MDSASEKEQAALLDRSLVFCNVIMVVTMMIEGAKLRDGKPGSAFEPLGLPCRGDAHVKAECYLLRPLTHHQQLPELARGDRS
jgi:hypothetical protein